MSARIVLKQARIVQPWRSNGSDSSGEGESVPTSGVSMGISVSKHVASTVERRLLFACAIFNAGLAAFPCVVMTSQVFRAMLGGVSGTMDASVSVSICSLEVLSSGIVSFFFGAIGTSVGVLHFCGGVLTVVEPFLKATLSSSSSSLHSFVVLVGIIKI